MDAEAAGSVAASESHNSSGQQEESQQQGGSVNYTAQSPRVPRSQISRAHPAHNAGFGERTSAVLSALSGDDETALSAAEAAGEHTSEPQDVVGCVGEAPGEALLPQQAHSLTAPPQRRHGHELGSSPPPSTSPMYRANSVVSHTAAAPHTTTRPNQQQQQQQHRGRGAETPASAPPAAAAAGQQHVLGSSPNTSRGEFSAILPQPRALRRPSGAPGGASGLPPTSGQRPGGGQQQQQVAAGPSRPSLSGTQSHAVTAPAAGPLPSTIAVALGSFSPPAGVLGQLSPQPGGGITLPSPQPPAAAYGAAGMAGLLPSLAASMGLPPSQLGSMAAALLQAQSSVLGTQQAAAQQQQQPEQQPQAAQQSASQQGTVMPPPPPLQALQQAEALQSMAAMLQAQASAIMSRAPAGVQQAAVAGQQQQQQQQQEGGGGVLSPPSGGQAAMSSPTAGAMQQQAAGVASEAGLQQASVGAASVQSLPSLVGASAIQGHPLPPPFYVAAATTPVPLHSYGANPAAVGAPPTVHSGAFAPPGPLAATPVHPHAVAAPAMSDMQGSAIQPAAAALLLQQQEGGATAAGVGGDGLAALSAQLQQAASMVQGGGGGGHGSGSLLRPSPSTDPVQRAAEEERQRHAQDPPQPQAAIIQELPTADVAAASQGGQQPLPPAVPQDAALMGVNSTYGDAMELGAEDDAMEVQQAAAGGRDPGMAEGQGGHLPPAPHGAASVMATLMTDNGGGRSEGDTEMQQTASGPSRNAAAQPAQSLSRSMAEPAAATAHNTRSAATQPSEQGPATSNHGQVVGHALSSLATVSTGNGERAGGSVEMSLLPSPPQQQHATSAPAVFGSPAALAGLTGGAAAAEGAAEAAGEVVSHAAANGGGVALMGAVSAPADMPVPPMQHADEPQVAVGGVLATPMAQPAASVSMSGQGDTPGAPLFGSGGGIGQPLPQSSVAPAVPPQLPLQLWQQQAPVNGQQQPHASVWEEHDMVPPTDARSRSQGAAAAAAASAEAAAAAVAGAAEGMGSPTASMHAAAPRESQGTARGTILAGAAHSILTTAAAGDGEAMDEGGEALSPLLAVKAAVQAAAAHAAAHNIRSMLGATPGTGSVGVPPAAAAAMPAAASSEMANPSSRPRQQQERQQELEQGQDGSQQLAAADGHAGHAGSAMANGFAEKHAHEEAAAEVQHVQAAASQGGVPSPAADGIDYSTMAVDMALVGTDSGNHPQATASFQPSHLPPPGAVAAAVAALERQQAVQNGRMYQTPPPAAAELGELYQALQHQNGYATHANSVIGNGYMNHSSPERELTSPSRLLTHDSTGGSGSQRRNDSKQAAKRRRTSVGPAGSSQHA